RVEANLARTRLRAELVVADAAVWDDARRFDAVLLDAPCSATGTFRRHPDVLRLVRPGDIAAQAALQARLLDAAADRVQAGGRLVFCTCSLEREEGEAQVAPFLSRHPQFAVSPADPEVLGLPAEAAADGGLRLMPSFWEQRGGMDGFFAVRFERAG
ncbi:MAG: rRNA methyltransferase, partial [Caulobacteraceae bacterium]|nr:rRNA methyltransferase [Caulobacter sp.]